MLSQLLTEGRLSVKIKLILAVAILLLSGLIISNYFNYKAFRKSTRNTVVNIILPLTCDNIYNEIQTDLKYGKNIPDLTGAGFKMNKIIPLLRTYKELYGSIIYLVDTSGIIQSHHNEKLAELANIHKLKGIKDIADTILTAKPGTAVYEFNRNNEHIYLTVRYIPEINRFLFVEVNENSKMGDIFKNIANNVLFDILISFATIAIFIFSLNYYQGKLDHMAVTDELTGAGNRREFDAQFRKSVYNYNRNGTPFSIIIFNIDNFKNLNNTMGHITGDLSIKAVAAIARDTMRLSDLLVRWGGDEFIILAQGDIDSAFLAAERLRKQVETGEIFTKYNGRNADKCDITISCGVSEFKKGDTLDSILARTNAALYKAKFEGRNRIYRG